MRSISSSAACGPIITPRPPDSPVGLTTSSSRRSSDMLEHFGVREQIGVDVLEDRLLAEVEPDHVRHEAVDGLVVGDAGTERVGDRDAPGSVGAHEARHAEQRVGPELQRVDEVVVEAPVDGVGALEPARGAHVQDVVADDQIRGLDELDAHLPRKERVLEVGGVGGPGSPHHDRRLALGGRSDRAQRTAAAAAGSDRRAGPGRRRKARVPGGPSPRGSRARRRSPRGCARCPRSPSMCRRCRAPGRSRRRGCRRRQEGGCHARRARNASRRQTSRHGTIPSRTISRAW